MTSRTTRWLDQIAHSCDRFKVYMMNDNQTPVRTKVHITSEAIFPHYSFRDGVTMASPVVSKPAMEDTNM